MERRNFFKSAAATSACMVAGSLGLLKANELKISDDKKVKITVIKRSLNEEFNNTYAGGSVKVCDVFTDNQEFILDSIWEAPKGFCQWAWADMRSFIMLVDGGKFETLITNCTDGIRPVSFKIEKV